MSCVLRMDLCFNFRDKGEDHSRGENDLRLKDKHHRKVKIKIEKVQSEVISFFSYHLLREKQYFSGKPPSSPKRARESEDCGVRRGACLREPCPLRGWSCPLPNLRDPSPRSNEDEETEQERAYLAAALFLFFHSDGNPGRPSPVVWKRCQVIAGHGEWTQVCGDCPCVGEESGERKRTGPEGKLPLPVITWTLPSPGLHPHVRPA